MGPQQHDALDPFAESYIVRKAKQMIGKTGFTLSDREDIEQELRFDLMRRWKHFNPAIAHRNIFVVTVVERHAIRMKQAKSAQCRSYRVAGPSLNAVLSNGDDTRLGDCLTTSSCQRRKARSARETDRLEDLRIDMAEVVMKLPADLQQLAELLKLHNVNQVARLLGIPRSTLNARVKKILGHFDRAWLRDYL